MPSLRTHLLRFILRRSANFGQRATLQELRDVFERDNAKFSKVAKGTLVEELGAAGTRTDGLSRLGQRGSPVILYLHGGAYTFASARSHRGFVSQIVEASGVRAQVVHLRLAPEHPFPASHDDALGAYERLLDSGVPADKIAVMGDSSGAALVLSMLFTVREQRLPMPACAVLISPWVDLTMKGASDRRQRGERRPSAREQAWRVGTHVRWRPRSTRPSALPALWRSASACRRCGWASGVTSSSIRMALSFADQAQSSGVSVETVIGAGMTHVWPLFYGLLPEAKLAIREIAAFVCAHTDTEALRAQAVAGRAGATTSTRSFTS